MNHSETLSNIATALNKAQAEFGPALKDANNPFFKSKYADLTSVWKAASEPLASNGLSIAQVGKLAEPIFYTNEKGETKVIIGVIVETVLMHSSGEWLSGETYYPIAKNDAQGVGSAITYGRRYGLAAILGIVADDDDGNAASGNSTSYQKKTERITDPPAPPPNNNWSPEDSNKAAAEIPNTPPPASDTPPPPLVDFGNGAAKKSETKLRELCKQLNAAGAPHFHLTEGETKWNSEALDSYCQQGFDKAIAQMDDDEMAIMIQDLEETLNERIAMNEESNSSSTTPATSANADLMITDKQLAGLTKLAEMKKANESKVAGEASGNRVGTFGALTSDEAQTAIKNLTKMKAS